VPETKKKTDLLLTSKENILETLNDVIALSERIENLRREYGVLNYELCEIVGSLSSDDKPPSPGTTWPSHLNRLNRSLTRLENATRRLADGVSHFKRLVTKSVLTAGGR